MGVRPGETGGDCPRCGERTVQIGYDASVVGAHCEECDLTVALTGEAMNAIGARNTDWSEHEARGASYGPDPNP